MNSDPMQTAMATWATRELPARLDATATARLLGFADHDIQILMAAGKLAPLGDPAPNAPKWFSAVEMILLAADREWLHRATKEVTKYWRRKREKSSHPAVGFRGAKQRQIRAEKPSPKSSPEPSPKELFGSVEGAMPGGERAVEKVA